MNSPTKEEILLAKEWADRYLKGSARNPSRIMMAVARLVVDYCTPDPEPPCDIDGRQQVAPKGEKG